MDEEEISNPPPSENEEGDITARHLPEEILGRRAYDHTWDVAVPGEEEFSVLPKPKGDSEKDNASEDQDEEEPEVLIQFENQEENLLSQYDDEDSYGDEDTYDYDDQYAYDESYEYDMSAYEYEYDPSYDYADPYGLVNSRIQNDFTNSGNMHAVTPHNFWMNNPPPRMMGGMRMPRFGPMVMGQPLPGPRGLMLPFTSPTPTILASGLQNPSASLTPTAVSATPNPAGASQSPQLQNILNQASLLMQMQNQNVPSAGTNAQKNSQSGYGTNYQTGTNSLGDYQGSTDSQSTPRVPGISQELEPPGQNDDSYSPDDPTQDESVISESDNSQVIQSSALFDISDIPTPRAPDKSDKLLKQNTVEGAEASNVTESPKLPKPVLGKAQAKKRLMAFANKFGVLPKVQLPKPKAKVDAVVGKSPDLTAKRVPESLKSRTEKGRVKTKDKVKSLLEELNDAKLKIESALEAQQQHSSSGKSKKHHEDRVPAIEEIVREESMSKGIQDYNNSAFNVERESAGRGSSGGKGRWKKSRYDNSDEENNHRSTPGRKFSERRRRYSKDHERDYKSKDDKTVSNQQSHRLSQERDPRKRDKDKFFKDSRKKKGGSRERDRKDFQILMPGSYAAKEREKEKEKEKEREKEKEFLRCRNWLQLKKSRLSSEEIVNRRKEDKLNKIRTAQDYAQHFDQMLMIGDHHLKRYPFIVEGQDGPKEFPPESVRVTKRGRGPQVLFSENPRVSLLLNRQQLYQAVPSDRRDKMRQICEANHLQINSLEETDSEQRKGWYDKMDDSKSPEEAKLKSKWESDSPILPLKGKPTDSEKAIAEDDRSLKDGILDDVFKEMVEIRKCKATVAPEVDSLIPEFFAESGTIKVNDETAPPRSPADRCVNHKTSKLVATVNKDNRDSTPSSASLGDEKLVSEYEQFMKMVSTDVPAPASSSGTIFKAGTGQCKYNVKKSEKIVQNDKVIGAEVGEMESVEEFDNQQRSYLAIETKSNESEDSVTAKIRSDDERDRSSSNGEESEGSPSVPSDWENVKIKEEKLSDESFDKKKSRKKKNKQTSSSESSSSSSSSSESDDDEDEEEEEIEKRSRKNKKKNKRKLIRKKLKKKAESSSESESSEDQTSQSSSDGEISRKRSRKKSKAKKKLRKVIVKKKRKRRVKSSESSSSDSDQKTKKRKKKEDKQLRRKQNEKNSSKDEEEASNKKSTETRRADKKKLAADCQEPINEIREVKEEKIDYIRAEVGSKELCTMAKDDGDRKKNSQDWGYDNRSIAIEDETELAVKENESKRKQDHKKKVVENDKRTDKDDKFLEEWEKVNMRMSQQTVPDERTSKLDLNKKKVRNVKDKFIEDLVKSQEEEKLKGKVKEAKLLEDWEKESICITPQIIQDDDLLKVSTDRKRKCKRSSSEWEEDDFRLSASSNIPSISLSETLNKRKERSTDEWEVDSVEENRETNEKKKTKQEKKVEKGVKYDEKTDTYIAVDRENAKEYKKKQNRLSAIRIWEEEEEEGEKEALMLMEQKTKHKKKGKSKNQWAADDSSVKLRTEEQWQNLERPADEIKHETKHWEMENKDSIGWKEKERDLEHLITKKRRSEKQKNLLFDDYYANNKETVGHDKDENRSTINEKLRTDHWLMMKSQEVSESKSLKTRRSEDWEDKDQEKTSDWEEAGEGESKKVVSNWVETFDMNKAAPLETVQTIDSSWQKKEEVTCELKKDKKSRWDVEDNLNKSTDPNDILEVQKRDSDKLLLIEWEEEHNEWIKNVASTFDELETVKSASKSKSILTKPTKKSKKSDESSDSYDLLNFKSKRPSESNTLSKPWGIVDDEKSHNSLSSLIELNFTNTRTKILDKNHKYSNQTSKETKSRAEISSKDNKSSLELYSPSSPALSQKSEDMEISSGNDTDPPKADALISNIPLPADQFPIMFGSQASSISTPATPPVAISSINTDSSIEANGNAEVSSAVEKPAINLQAEVKLDDVLLTPKLELENLMSDEKISKWGTEDIGSKKTSSEHSDKSSVSSSSAETSLEKNKIKNRLDIFADYESSSNSCEKTESENDLQSDDIHPDIKEEKLKSPLKLIPNQILSKTYLETQKVDIVQGTISFKIQKKVLQTNILPSDDYEDSIDEFDKPCKPDNQFQKHKPAAFGANDSIFKDSHVDKNADGGGEAVSSQQFLASPINSDKVLPKFEGSERKEDDKYDDFSIGKREIDRTIHRSRSRSISQSRSRSRSRDRRKKSPDRRERDRWSREDRRRSRGVETRERDKSVKRERLNSPTYENRNRSNSRYSDRGDSRRRTSPGKGRAGGRRNRSRSPNLRKRSPERSRSRSPVGRRDRERSPKRRMDGDKKMLNKLCDKFDEKDDKDFFNDDEVGKFKISEGRRDRNLRSPIRYHASTAADDNRKFPSVEHKLDKERNRGRYRDSIERDRETRSYDPMEILREKGLEAERYRNRLQAENENRQYQWNYEREEDEDEDDGRGLFPNEFDLDFEERRLLGRGDSFERDAAEGSIHPSPLSRSKHQERSIESRSKRSRDRSRGREQESPNSEGRENRSSYSRSRSPPRLTTSRGSTNRYKSSRKSRSRSRTPDRNLRTVKRLHRSRSSSLGREEDDQLLNENCTTGRRIETIVQAVTTVTGITGVIADSTISDSELLANNECISHDGSLRYANNTNSNTDYYYYSEGNLTYPPRIEETHQSASIGTGSPKRLSLDDRLELELGIKKKQQQQIPTIAQDPQHVGYHPAAFSTNIATYPALPPTVVPPLQQSPYQQQPPKVLQVGNVLQVIPSEFAGIPPPQRELPAAVVPSSSHVVRVGNVLQVVPSTHEWATGPSPSDTINPAYHRPCPSATPIGVPPPSPAALTLIPASTVSPIPVPRPEIVMTVAQPVYNYEAILEERRKGREERKKVREERRKEKEFRRVERRKRRADKLVKKNLALRQQEGATFQLQHAPSPPITTPIGIEDEEDEEVNSGDQSLPSCEDEIYQQAAQKQEGIDETIEESNEETAKDNKDPKNEWLPLLPPPAKGILIFPGFGRESMSNGDPGYLFEPKEDDDDEECGKDNELLATSTDADVTLSEEQVETQLQSIIDESKAKDGTVVGKSKDEEKEVEIRRKKIIRRRSRKSVQFADGVRPGEGTSPSGGEGDMPSPPPPIPLSVLPLRNSNIMNHNLLRGNDKRIKIKKSKKKHQKTKPPKTKKKVKVKIIKLKKSRAPVPSPLTIEDLEELDERSPPPPPPGSPPPPHLWPSYLAAYNAAVHSLNPMNFEPPPPPSAVASPPPTPLPLLVPPPPLNYTIQPCNKA